MPRNIWRTYRTYIFHNKNYIFNNKNRTFIIIAEDISIGRVDLKIIRKDSYDINNLTN